MKSLTILIIFLMAACGGGTSSEEIISSDFEALTAIPEESYDVSSQQKASSSQTPAAEEFQKKVIKTGGLSYKVESVAGEYVRLTQLLKNFEGYIASENESKGYDRVNYSISVKVPPQNFDPLISAISSDLKIENKWVRSDDVTDQYYDLQSRINNKKKLEERYQDILKKATNVKDILEVERNLNEVRGEIESLQGQFKLLSHRVAYSSLELSFYEVIPYELNQEPRPGFGTRLINAFSGGWQGFLSFLVVIVQLWPFGLVALGIIWLVKKIRARKSSGLNNSNQE